MGSKRQRGESIVGMLASVAFFVLSLFCFFSGSIGPGFGFVILAFVVFTASAS
jgi:hypothetical protein